MPSVLITGANRGIGLEMARQYVVDGWTVHGTCRASSDAAALKDTGAEVHTLDVTDHAGVDALARTLTDPLDVVVANAGVMGPRNGGAQAFGTLDYPAFHQVMAANVLGALKTCEAFTPHLEKGEQKKLACITSKMGSIDDSSGGMIMYRTSKAALNMALAAASPALAEKGIAAILIHPGWVQTDMGGPSALISAEESVRGIRDRIDGARPTDKPPFRAYNGRDIPW